MTGTPSAGDADAGRVLKGCRFAALNPSTAPAHGDRTVGLGGGISEGFRAAAAGARDEHLNAVVSIIKFGDRQMTEQELRAAVAEYDEELARFGDREFGSELYCEDDALYWRIQDSTISREQDHS